MLGVPAAYGFGDGPGVRRTTRELAGFLSYGHGYGLLQHDLVREYLLELYALSAHQYTRGTWTAPETRRIDPGQPGRAVLRTRPARVPLLLRWLLVWEEPGPNVLWLCRAAPRSWFAVGGSIAAERAPTRWGRLGFRITTRVDAEGQHVVDVSVALPDRAAPARVGYGSVCPTDDGSTGWKRSAAPEPPSGPRWRTTRRS